MSFSTDHCSPKRSLKRLCQALPLLALILAVPAHAAPQGKVDCIAPAQPGGGWDFTCRSVARALQDLSMIPAAMQTINVPGASGGVAFSHVQAKRASDDDLIVAASTATTTQLALGNYPGGRADQVRWVATLGADYGVIAVAKDSPYQSLTQLLDALKADAGSVTFSGGDVAGGFDHIKVLMAARKAGVKPIRDIKYLAFDSGSVAISQLLGGHIDAFTGDISEAKSFVDSGDLRILAVFSDERLPGQFADIPTAKEQGIDVVAPNWRGFYTPAGASEESYAWWKKTLNGLYDTPQWQQIMTQNGLLPFHKSGDELNQFVARQISDIQEIGAELGMTH
ncbi:C4-dicarboxylate ABC transporter substrate-binding protein [Salinicola sp. MH3R3-1]|uniref:Bug family tripartite tricarboxylate transporter substrate binding protein n=1 Tax=Salinicola sp. MH3R3-1 TaxID=1928762 RepID=UPI00094ED9E1|nr:tripartite tricarboxylate transporter substrate-binding protein [Salinicola sp. MH3R3-1]OLO07697.1 C4-dicarboxylate ABC transporter substrate-binding protein [Salinicola sp. MH3R3-1]